MDIRELLEMTVAREGSDLHLTVGVPPTIRLYGELVPLGDFPPLTKENTRDLAFAMLSPEQQEKFEKELELDFSYNVENVARFRVNLYWQKEAVGAAIRVIPTIIPSPEEIGLTPEVVNLANLRNGLILVTGPTGTGKSTTLAALIDKINRESAKHILTIEDPIEFVYTNKMSIINQREVGAHTWSFANALKHALRQDPDVILVGEMRDLETIAATLTIAETGHLAFATLHTNDAPQTIDRIIDVFPPHQQQQIRTVLAAVLRAVICQQLIPRRDGLGRVVAREILLCTPAIANLIRDGRTPQIYSEIQTGASKGMRTMEADVKKLLAEGLITPEAAARAVSHPEALVDVF
jgi:twitching motility protein PilT